MDMCNLLAENPTPSASSSKGYGQISFAPPVGWRLDRDVRMKNCYWLTSLRESGRRCLVSLQSEGVRTLEDSQSGKSVRFRELLAGPNEPTILRAKLRSRTGVLILKADVRYTPRTHPQISLGVFRHIVYSFRGPDRRIYTFQCSTPTRDTFFDRALDDLAKSIEF